MAFILSALLFALIFHSRNTTASQCPTTGSQYGYALEGHVFKSFTTERLAFCYSACNTDPTCQSMNFHLARYICELNTQLGRTHPQDFKEQESYVYAENPHRGKKGSHEAPGESCKDIKESGDYTTTGTYWIRPAGSSDRFQGYCDMSAVGQWKKVTQALVESTHKGGVTLTYSEGNNGFTISGQVTSWGCGSGPAPGALTLLKGYWTKIKYTQEFRGRASCWSIFGDQERGYSSVGNTPNGVHSFDSSQGDTVTNEYYMGGNSHPFNGVTSKCDHASNNFWHSNKSLRYATVVLRRNLIAEKAGIFTGTSCGTPTYKIKDIYVYF